MTALVILAFLILMLIGTPVFALMAALGVWLFHAGGSDQAAQSIIVEIPRLASLPSLIAIPLAALVYLAPFLLSVVTTGSTEGLEMVYRENIRRFFDPVNHRGPIYLYGYVIFLLLAPWSLLLPAALAQAHGSADKQSRGRAFALAYFWGTFLFFTLSSSRRSYYLLPILPAAAFLMQLLRSPNPVDHPTEGLTPADPDFHLRVKPRGLVQSRAIASLDTGLEGGHSKVIGAYIKKDETAGNRHSTDVAEQAEFDALLLHVEQRLGELADQVFSGDVTAAPYLMGGLTPCARCEYRSVCRFEPGINRYRVLPAMKREEVLTAVTTT